MVDDDADDRNNKAIPRRRRPGKRDISTLFIIILLFFFDVVRKSMFASHQAPKTAGLLRPLLISSCFSGQLPTKKAYALRQVLETFYLITLR